MPPGLNQRRALLTAALGFARVRVSDPPPALLALRGWLDSWPGLGAIVTGLARQGYDIQLTRYDESGWRATFYVDGMAHSIVAGTAWEPTPWRAVQEAGWQTTRSSKD